MPASHVDGNDAMRVYDAVTAAATRARSGEGPTMIVADTYRWREHCGPNFDNMIGYRAPAEFETWRAHCPVAALETSLRADGLLGKPDISALNREIAQEIESAFAFAADSPFPDPETNGSHIYA
jgi:pyruvate dehydrogenase E1 component alpha subunit